MIKGIVMACAAREYVDEVLETYMLALAGLDQCPDSAGAIRERLAANVERAERLFSDAVADGLAEASAAVDEAAQRLARANEASRAGYRNGRAIGDLLADLEQATEQAEGVLRASRG